MASSIRSISQTPLSSQECCTRILAVFDCLADLPINTQLGGDPQRNPHSLHVRHRLASLIPGLPSLAHPAHGMVVSQDLATPLGHDRELAQRLFLRSVWVSRPMSVER